MVQTSPIKQLLIKEVKLLASLAVKLSFTDSEVHVVSEVVFAGENS